MRKEAFYLIFGTLGAGIFLLFSGAALANTQYDTMKSLESMQNPSGSLENKLQIPVINYTSERLRDPFKSLLHKTPDKTTTGGEEVPEVVVLPNLTVQGVILGSDLKQVIINDTILKEGESINGVSILDIQKEGVAVLYKNQRFQLSAPGNVYRK